MALTINYKVSPDTVTATLYRSIGSKIDLRSLPGSPTVLDKAKTQYVYSDGVNNTHYSFVIETIDVNGRKNYSPIQDIFYKTELGPGPTKITRGYFDFGVYGELTSEELGISPDALRDIILADGGNPPVLSSTPGIPDNLWYKCLVNKRVLYIPAGRFLHLGFTINRTAANTYSLTRLCDANGLVDDCMIISVNGNDYKLRTFLHHDADLTGPAALAAMKDCVVDGGRKDRSEIGMYTCLTTGAAGGSHIGTDKEGFGLPYDGSGTTALFRGGNITPLGGTAGERRISSLGGDSWPSAGTTVGTGYDPIPTTQRAGGGSSNPLYYWTLIPILELLD